MKQFDIDSIINLLFSLSISIIKKRQAEITKDTIKQINIWLNAIIIKL